uniref:SSD domain-containing protein n=2 Tax=Caenorhabditis tropicalis TaxID=1561998 RepID=A0A1I7UDK4_9PELO
MTTRRTQRMHAQDSWEWAHATHRISTIYIYFFISSMIFVAVSLYFFSKEFVVSPDNFSELAHSYRSDYTNKTEISYDEVISAMNPFHPFHKFLARNHIRHGFGNVYVNHCYIFPYPNGTNLPSILRRMTFSAPSQASMRTAVLITVLLRMVIILIRTSDVVLQNPLKQAKIRCVGCICTVTDLLVSIFGMFVTCLHASVDLKDMSFLVYYSLPLFGASFFISAISYTYLESYDVNRKNSRVLERAFCIALFAFCLPVVCKDYISFLFTQPCLYHAEWLPAVCEYICIVSIIIFYLTQIEDFTKMHMVLSCEREETMCCMDFIDFSDFKPAMLHDFHELIQHQKAQEEKRLHKSIIFIS